MNKTSVRAKAKINTTNTILVLERQYLKIALTARKIAIIGQIKYEKKKANDVESPKTSVAHVELDLTLTDIHSFIRSITIKSKCFP